MLVTTGDITKLKSSEEKLKKAQEISHIGSKSMDIATTKVIWSEELYKMYGFDCKLELPPYEEHKKIFTTKSWEVLPKVIAIRAKTEVYHELDLELI